MTITLRTLLPEDASLLAQYANNPLIAQRLTNRFPHPYTQQHAQDFIATATQHNPRKINAITIDGAFAGCIGIHPQDDVWQHNVELGYWLAQPFWGKGVMTEALRQILLYSWSNFPTVQRIFARPFGSNQGSARVLEKAGFQLEARLSRTIFKAGIYEDELIYSIWRPQNN